MKTAQQTLAVIKEREERSLRKAGGLGSSLKGGFENGRILSAREDELRLGSHASSLRLEE